MKYGDIPPSQEKVGQTTLERLEEAFSILRQYQMKLNLAFRVDLGKFLWFLLSNRRIVQKLTRQIGLEQICVQDHEQMITFLWCFEKISCLEWRVWQGVQKAEAILGQSIIVEAAQVGWHIANLLINYSACCPDLLCQRINKGPKIGLLHKQGLQRDRVEIHLNENVSFCFITYSQTIVILLSSPHHQGCH